MTAFATPYPVNLDLAGADVLVVGAGTVAARKVAGLVRAGARVTVVAPDAAPDIAANPDVVWERRAYVPGEVAGYRLAITATSDPSVNAQVAADGKAANVLVNSADDPKNCSFILPAVVNRGDLQITVSTNGRSPALAAWLRKRLEAEFDAAYSGLLDLLEEVRLECRTYFGTSELEGWDAAIDDGLIDLIRTGRLDDARQQVRNALNLPMESHS
jgi:precorrin-2 dehydrogenase/sirohydrochlorin ferrochelatase